MNAHIVPIVYLKEFAIPSKKRSRSKEIYQITNQGLCPDNPVLNDICNAIDFYSDDNEIDKDLFSRQENYFGSLKRNLASNNIDADELSKHLWMLFARNRTIHENARYRVELAKASQNAPFTNRGYSLLKIGNQNDIFITSDNPVLIRCSFGDLNDLLMIVPITPQSLLVSFPLERITTHGNVVTSKDVQLLNEEQAAGCYEYVLTGRKPTSTEVRAYSELIKPCKVIYRSEAMIHSPKQHAIINFTSGVYRKGERPYSFLEVIE